ncbi:hypothetical protein X777_14110, partial [Ooceraea biroi]
FPERGRHPSKHAIMRCVQRARETGSLQPRRNDMCNARDDEERILRMFKENPRSSVHRAAHALGYSRYVVHRTLRQNALHPYHFQRVQQLLPRDAEQRIYFCEGFLAQCRRNLLFPDRILWTDEATFTPNGISTARW